MPLAPALKGLLLASSLIAAGVAAYETDPNVRAFVDRTTKRAEDALMDFLENLDREFSPDGVGRRRREMMDVRAGRAFGGEDERRSEDADVIVASGRGMELQPIRQRKIEILDAENGNGNGNEDGGDGFEGGQGLGSMHTSATHETLFEQVPSSLSSSPFRNIPIDDDITTPHNFNTSLLDTNNDEDEDIASQTTASMDDLSDLDPFAVPRSESHTPLVLSIPALAPTPLNHEQQDRTPVTPTSFATSQSPHILTPVTPRTVASGGGDEVSESYFSDFSAGSVGGEGGRRLMEKRGEEDADMAVRSRSVSVASSGVGFETPDEDEDDVDWGRA